MARLREQDGARRAERDLGAASPADYSEALERGLHVLTAFGGGAERLTQADLARRLDLPRATVRRSVMTLVHLGYVEADGRNYRLTSKVLELAAAYLGSNPVTTVLQPLCEQLCARFDASSTVAVLDGPDAVMIARAVPQQSILTGAGMGFRVPAARSALGRVLLAALTEHERDEQLRDEVARAAADGYAYVADEVELGFHSVAVPLRRWDGRPVAALNVGCRADRVPAARMHEEVLPALREAADSVRPRLL